MRNTFQRAAMAREAQQMQLLVQGGEISEGARIRLQPIRRVRNQVGMGLCVQRCVAGQLLVAHVVNVGWRSTKHA
ncbi:hypothetical protein DXT87_14650 [Arthrobacter sp. AET 35A]|nr:hypothetical protein [Arthrobacter sp. AET 35A]